MRLRPWERRSEEHVASIFSQLDPSIRDAILQELLAQEKGSIRARDPSLEEQAGSEREQAQARDVASMRGLSTDQPGVIEMIQQVGTAAANVARGLMPFVGAVQERGTGGGFPVPGTGSEVRPAPAILDAIDAVLPGAGEAGFILPALARRLRRRGPDLTPEGVEMETALRARAEEELTTPEQLADALEEARFARESTTGAQAGRLGLQGSPEASIYGESAALRREGGEPPNIELTRLQDDLEQFQRYAAQQGFRGVVEERITEDVMLDNIVEMLRFGEIGTIGPVKRGDVVELLPRERTRITEHELLDVEPPAQAGAPSPLARAPQEPPGPASSAEGAIRSVTEYGGDRVVEHMNGWITIHAGGDRIRFLTPGEANRYASLYPDDAFAQAWQRHLQGPAPSGAAVAEQISNQRALDAYVDDQLAALDSGELDYATFLRGMSGEDASSFIESMNRRGIDRPGVYNVLREAMGDAEADASAALQALEEARPLPVPGARAWRPTPASDRLVETMDRALREGRMSQEQLRSTIDSAHPEAFQRMLRERFQSYIEHPAPAPQRPLRQRGRTEEGE